MAKKISKVLFKYSDDRYLTMEYMGDGDYSLILTNSISEDSLFNPTDTIEELFEGCDGVYDEENNYIQDDVDIEDFTTIPNDINNPI